MRIPSPYEVRAKAVKQHSEAFTCSHAEVALRRRVVSKGLIQRVEQCQRCGQAVSRAIGKAEALQRCGGSEPPSFDEALCAWWDKDRQAGYERIEATYRSQLNTPPADEWRVLYDAYLSNDEWKQKRQKVLRRAGGKCEGCADAAASEVHHTTYAHVGDEFLFELVALCEPCHRRFHSRQSASPDEDVFADFG